MSKAKTIAKEKLSINLDETKKAAIALRALNHKMRQKMLELIDANKEMRVTDIYRKLKLEQSLTSSYLALLRKAGAVKNKKRRAGDILFCELCSLVYD